ncbi:MAG: hypothetical protein U5L02_06500 [Rheinheimera sp.]|nr:hypothetical protein [Rheinheimera sp.]
MRANDLILRCYAKKDGDVWVAVCIDLCLAAQGQTLNEVKQKLEVMTRSYIKGAFEEDREYAGQLLARKAPLSQQATYHWIKFLNTCVNFKHNVKAFAEVMPMKLAV